MLAKCCVCKKEKPIAIVRYPCPPEFIEDSDKDTWNITNAGACADCKDRFLKAWDKWSLSQEEKKCSKS